MSETATSIPTAPSGSGQFRYALWGKVENVLTGAEYSMVWVPESDDDKRLASSLRLPGDEDLALLDTPREPMN